MTPAVADFILVLALIGAGTLWRASGSCRAPSLAPPDRPRGWPVATSDLLVAAWVTATVAVILPSVLAPVLPVGNGPAGDQLRAGLALQLSLLLAALVGRAWLRRTAPDPTRPPEPAPVAAPRDARATLRAGADALLGLLPLVLGVALVWQGILAAFVAAGFDLPVDLQEVARAFGPEHPLGTRILLVLLAVVLAPIAEEALFRGGLFPLLARWLRPGTASVVSAAAFAAIHLNLAASVPLFVLALGLNAVAARHGIGAAIVVHAGFNLLSVTRLLLFGLPPEPLPSAP